ncbi:hypothetical protein T12_10593 [Trichinella patagoniensis]|uniref:Uncharacterized protein n=1 Tax=Trichinella patagoniensis TaxID=990121 RepID=A0A0V1A859_9BILA|nr:hypothetical protein T12_10593 [Trichinella patagoniensis]
MTVIIPFMTLSAIVYLDTINLEVHEMEPLRKASINFILILSNNYNGHSSIGKAFAVSSEIFAKICKIYPTSVLNPEDPKKTKDILMERLYSAHLYWSGCLGTGLELTANKNMKHFYLRTVGVTGRVQEVHL